MSGHSAIMTYCCPPGGRFAGDLLVDYQWVRLQDTPFEGAKSCCELADLEGEYDEIVFNIPSYTPDAQLRYDLNAAVHLLQKHGKLTLHFSEKRFRRYLKRHLKSIFGETGTTTDGDGLWGRAAKSETAVEPPAQEFIFYDAASARQIVLTGRPGLFAANRIDEGTALLLDVLDKELEGKHVLDLGCGVGPLGMVAACRGASVSMTDADYRAIKCTRRGLEFNGIQADTLIGDGARALPNHQFDIVISNPPTHAGSAKLQDLFRDMARVLRLDGYALLVLRKHLNYEKWLNALGRVTTLCTDKGYKILKLDCIASKTIP